ncbi:PDZ domain-containing protein [Ralstonia soli]|uniref:PDZ domain-containing protein n=1 Tax=Ralstonia soli TaxID=2953896 RepID=A0ABT1AII7_9RALS|nr:PDZ domain-containing protein [Ralstonia soli]MCO5398227.1 PDZ domain-containing protein [Ralstonia soli]
MLGLLPRKCATVVLAAAGILSGCATAPENNGAVLNVYRQLDCNTLKERDALFNRALTGSPQNQAAQMWREHAAMVNQARAEKHCGDSGGAVAQRPRIGIQVAPVPASLATALGLSSTSGALIVDVMKGLPADKAGIEKMDVVLGMDGKKLATPDEVLAAIKQLGVGAKTNVQIWRNRSVKDYVVDLSAESTNGAPPTTDLVMEAAAGDFDAGRYFDAFKKYQKVVKQNPNDALAWYFIGQSLDKMHDAAGAKTAYQRVIDIQPQGQIADYARQMLANLSQPATASGKAAQKKK